MNSNGKGFRLEITLHVPMNERLVAEMRAMALARRLSLERWCSEVLMDRISTERLTHVKSGGEPILPGNKR